MRGGPLPTFKGMPHHNVRRKNGLSFVLGFTGVIFCGLASTQAQAQARQENLAWKKKVVASTGFFVRRWCDREELFIPTVTAQFFKMESEPAPEMWKRHITSSSCMNRTARP